MIDDDNHECLIKQRIGGIAMYRLYMTYEIRRRKELQKQMAYCNNHIIPLLEENNIEWDYYDTVRIVICGKAFPIKYIDNGDAEAFIRTLINKDEKVVVTRQSVLEEFKKNLKN